LLLIGVMGLRCEKCGLKCIVEEEKVKKRWKREE